MLLDGNSLLFRAFFAIPDEMATSKGLPTNAVYGFLSMLVNLLKDHRPDGIAVAFDRAEPTFRHDAVADYKAGRAETPDTLSPQFTLVKQLLDAMGVAVVEAPGYEADDVIATLARKAAERGDDVIVVSGDRDTFQLVSDPHVRVLYNKRGVTDYELYDEAGIQARTGVKPRDYVLYAALRGDPSDNLPGVPGVGEKTAAKLVNAYGDIDGIYSHLGELTPKLRTSLEESEDQVRSNLRMMPLVTDLDLDLGPGDERLRLGRWDVARLAQVLDELEFRTLRNRLAEALGEPAIADRSATPASRASADGGAKPPIEAARQRKQPAEVVPQESLHDGTAVALARLATLQGLEPLRPSRVADAADAIDALAEWAGAIGVDLTWEGDPGRSPVRELWVVGVEALGGPGAANGPESQRGRAAAVLLDGGLVAAKRVAGALKRALSGRASVVASRTKEALRSLIPLGVRWRSLSMDVGVAAYLLDPDREDYPVAGLIGTYFGEDALGALNGADVGLSRASAVLALEPILRQRLVADGMGELYDEVENPLIEVLAAMEVVGIGVDVERLRRLHAELAEEASRLDREIQELAGEPFMVNSTKQLREVLYSKLGLTPSRKTKTGYSTDAASLERLRGEHPIVEKLLRYREVEKLRSTYGTSLIDEVDPSDGRIHASFNQTVARTGRLSSDRPNLHNIPVRTEDGRRFREAFVPAPGFRFLVADYNQIELRIIAHLSGDEALLEAFRSHQDIHTATAARLFGVEPSAVSALQRSKAKMVSYGLSYGMEAYGLARRLGIGVDEAQRILSAYFESFPKVKAFMDSCVLEARARGYAVTELGRRRPLPELSSANRQVRLAAERQAMNAYVQGLAADIFKLALVRLARSMEETGLRARIVLQVHDEVVVEVPAGEEESAEAQVREAMEGAYTLRVPLEVEASWGDSWADAKY